MRTKLALCCAVVCLPLGCVGLQADDDESDALDLPHGTESIVPKIPAGPCTGRECNGRMPYGAGCEEDARILASKTFPGGRVSLHYSPSCGTKWANVWRKDRRYSFAWVETEKGAGEAQTTTDRAQLSFDTRMFNAPDTPMRACVEPTRCKTACDNGYGRTYCTDYR